MLDLGERYRIVPETVALANEAVQETVAATRADELALAKGLDKPEEDSLRQELRALADVSEGAMDVRRKIAEYEEATNEYELQTQMLHSMQESYAKGQVNLTMPLVLITIHEQVEVAISPLRESWLDLL